MFSSTVWTGGTKVLTGSRCRVTSFRGNVAKTSNRFLICTLVQSHLRPQGGGPNRTEPLSWPEKKRARRLAKSPLFVLKPLPEGMKIYNSQLATGRRLKSDSGCPFQETWFLSGLRTHRDGSLAVIENMRKFYESIHVCKNMLIHKNLFFFFNGFSEWQT